jgi:hypothetical protein
VIYSRAFTSVMNRLRKPSDRGGNRQARVTAFAEPLH